MTTPLRVAVLVVAALVAAPLALTALAYLAAARARRAVGRSPAADDEDAPRAVRALAFAAVFMRECAATVRVLGSAPLGFVAARARGRGGAARRPPRVAVLVPDFAASRASLRRLAARLVRDGFDRAVPVAHGPGGTLEARAARLGRAVDAVREITGAATVDVLAHGLGGLVARAWLRTRGRDAGVARLITLGTAHQGTEALRWLLPTFARPGSPALGQLAREEPLPARLECTAIYSDGDACIVPAQNAYYPGAFNVEIRGVGHATLLFSPRVYELVRESLEVEPVVVPRAGADRW